MLIQICVGSSCHLKGAPDIVELFKTAAENSEFEPEIALAGCFCAGKCGRDGITVIVDDETFTGVTKENFNSFWNERINIKLKEQNLNG